MKTCMQKVSIFFSSKKSSLLKSCGMIAAVLIVSAGTPLVYISLEQLWFRLLFVICMMPVLFFVLRGLYRYQYWRQNGRRALHGALNRTGIFFAASLLLIAVMFLLFALILGLLSLPIKTYQMIAVYGSYVLTVLLFPVVSLLLYLPVVKKAGWIESLNMLWQGLRGQYFTLLLLSVIIVLINIGISLLIDNIVVMMIISIVLSTALWTFSWEICLLHFSKEAKNG